jgi:hypothetical protein
MRRVKMKSINDGSSNTPANKTDPLSEMEFAVKRLIKRAVLHDDKCTGIIADNVEGSNNALKVFIPRNDVDIDLLKSKLEICLFNCGDIKVDSAGTSCIVSRMDKKKALARQLRALIRARLGEPENSELVAITSFSKSRKRIEIAIRHSNVDEEHFSGFLDIGLSLSPMKIRCENGEIVFQCKIKDYEEFDASVGMGYWLDSPIAPFEDVQSFVLSRWDDPEWRVEMAQSDDKRDYVFILVSNIRGSNEETFEALRLAEHKLNIVLTRYGVGSFKGYLRNTEKSHHTISACYYVPKGRFGDGWAANAHIRDCELDPK